MAIIGISGKLEYESGSGWAEVYNCKQVNFPSFNVSSVDTSNLGCTDYAMTFIPGMVDSGTITFEAEYQAATYDALVALLRTVIGWRVSSPTGDDELVVSCDGFLTKCDVSITPNDEVMISGEVKMTGLPEVDEGEE